MEKKLDDHIFITEENLGSYGFSCFYYKDENPSEDFLVREVVLAVGGKTGNLIRKLKIPKSLVIQLSQQLKITNNPNFQIRKDSTAINAIKLLSERAAWNQTESDLRAMLAHGHDDVFIASYDHEKMSIPLGSGISLPLEDMCWIGMILVHPELRRQGIARSVMHACITHARKVQQKSIIGLDATPEGKQVYDALGFKNSFLIHRSLISTSLNHDIISRATQQFPFDLSQVKDFLEEKEYTERLQIVELLEKLPEAKNIMNIRNGKVQGFVMSRPGRLKPFIGPLIANNPEIAKALLMEMLQYWRNRGFEEVLMDIPDMHIHPDAVFVNMTDLSNSDLQQIPVHPVRSFVRMYQLISKNENDDEAQMDHEVWQDSVRSYQLSLDFMNKERNIIVPMMFGTAGPEWS